MINQPPSTNYPSPLPEQRPPSNDATEPIADRENRATTREGRGKMVAARGEDERRGKEGSSGQVRVKTGGEDVVARFDRFPRSRLTTISGGGGRG